MSEEQIEDWLPAYQVRARHSILVRSSIEETFAALTMAKFSDIPIVRGLMRLRGYRVAREQSTSSTLTEQCRRFGSFLELAIVPPEEVVLGIAGRFWRPDGGIVRNLTSQEFRDFRRDGYAKAVWNFHLVAVDGSTQLSTETRVQTFGRLATLKFRSYWLLVGFFSGLIREAMMREVKRIAEHTAA